MSQSLLHIIRTVYQCSFVKRLSGRLKEEALDEVFELKDKLDTVHKRIEKLTDEVKDLEANSSSAKDNYIMKLESLISKAEAAGET